MTAWELNIEGETTLVETREMAFDTLMKIQRWLFETHDTFYDAVDITIREIEIFSNAEAAYKNFCGVGD
jgi:hypothetical protein